MANDESNPNQGSQAPPAGTDAASQGSSQPPVSSSDELKKLIQSETDKVRQQLWGEIKKKDAAIEELKKSQMTEAELRKYKESQLAEREILLQRKELELTAVDVLRDSGIPLSLRDFVIGKDVDETKARAASLKTELQKAVEAAVAEKFKAAGREPGKPSDPPSGSKRTYTRAEIEELGKKASDRGLPLAERAKISEEMRAALLEGRIKS